MLAGQISNQDEDEVEDELEALQREIEGVSLMPDVPTVALPDKTEIEQSRKAKARAKARAEERAALIAA